MAFGLREISFVVGVFSVACGSSDAAPSVASGTGGAGSAAGAGGQAAGGSSTADLGLTSTVFHDGETIPAENRCAAASPDLAWSGGPSDAKSDAIVFND